MASEGKRSFALLFGDNFSHEEEDGGKEELHLDLVRFPHPVCVREVRVIPAGFRYHPQLPERYGHTKPASFKLDMFVRNLRQPEVSVFERLATMDYMETDFLCTPKSKIVTDMFIVKGWYSNLTICLYGHVIGRDPIVSPSVERSLSEESLLPKPAHAPPVRSEQHSSRSEHHQQQHHHHHHHHQQQPPQQRHHAHPPRQDLGPRPEPLLPHPPFAGPHPPHVHRPEQAISQGEHSATPHSHPLPLLERPTQDHPPPPRMPRQSHSVRSDMPAPPPPPATTASQVVRLSQTSLLSDVPPFSSAPHPLVAPSRNVLAPSASTAPLVTRMVIREEPVAAAVSTERRTLTSAMDMKVVVPNRSMEKPMSITRTVVNRKEDIAAATAPGEDTAMEREVLDVDGDSLPSDDSSDDDGGLDVGPQLDLELFGEDEAWMSLSVGFNPYEEIDLMPLNAIPPCHQTKHEKEVKTLRQQSSLASELPALTEGGSHLRDLVHQMRDSSDSYQVLLMLEKIAGLSGNFLAEVICIEPAGSAVSFLTEAVLRSLDWTFLSGLELTVNIRYLKAGVRLVVALAECGGEAIASLLSAGALQALCTLLKVDGLVSSIKVLVLRAIDTVLDFPLAMESFLGWNVTDGKEDGEETWYRFLLSFLMQGQSARVIQCGRVLLTKLNCYEQLARLQAQVDAVAASACPIKVELDEEEAENSMEWQESSGQADADNAAIPGGSGISLEQPMDDGDSAGTAARPRSSAGDGGVIDSGDARPQTKPASDASDEVNASVEELPSEQSIDEDTAELVLNEDLALELANFALITLGKLLAIFKNADEILVQLPAKICPTKCQLVEFSPRSPWPGLVRWCNARRFLDILLVMLSSPQLSSYPQIFALIRDVLLQFVRTEPGLLFLAEHYTTSNEIIRVLSQASESDLHISRLLTLQDVVHNPDSCTPQNLGMILLYHLQTLKAVDVLVEKAPQSGKDLDCAEVLASLHLLYTMMFTPIGKYACSYVLTQGSNIEALLAFATPTDDEDWNLKLKCSISQSYVSNLLLAILQTSDSVTYLCHAGGKLLAVAEGSGSNELKAWIEPVRCLQKPDTDFVAGLVGLVQSTVNELCASNLAVLPTVVSALRLLQHMCCPPAERCSAVNDGLRWKSACLSLLSANAIEVLLTTGQKLGAIQEPLWLQGHLLAHPRVSQFLSLACSLLAVILELMIQLSTADSLQFFDCRFVTMVVHLHSVMCCAQPSMLSTAAQQVQRYVVQILATFTKAPSGHALADDGASARKQPWCMMLDALLGFLEKAPQNFIGGLVLFSELLPLPLPILGARKLTVEQTLSQRQLWSGQLKVHEERLRFLILRLSDTSCGALVQQVRKFCCQLADVDHSMALVVVRPLLEVIMLPAAEPRTGGSLPSYRILNQLASLLIQPSVKAAALYALRVDGTWPGVVKVLTAQCCSAAGASDVAQFAMSILQALLDPLTLSSSSVGKLSLQQLANSLPPVDVSLQILGALQQHLANKSTPFSSTLAMLRTHAMWLQHEPLLTILFSQSKSLRDALNMVVKRLSSSFRPGCSPTSDEMSTLSTVLELLHMLCCRPCESETDADGAVDKTGVDTGNSGTVQDTLTNPPGSRADATRLYRLIQWTSSPGHPLQDLASALSRHSQEDSGFAAFLEALQLVTEGLAQVTDKQLRSLPAEVEAVEDVLPHSQPLGQVFRECAIMMSEGQEDGSNHLLDLWLHPPLSEDGDAEQEWVELNLEELAKKYCPGWSLAEEVNNCLALTPSDSAAAAKRSRTMKRKFDPLISRMRNRSQPVPLRGRGRMLTQKLQRSDLFRLRKQNSSRAPSMHVDDFMVLEGDSQARPHQSHPQRGGGGGGRGGMAGHGMRRGDFGGHFGHHGGGGGPGPNMPSPQGSMFMPPWAQPNSQRFNPRMHGRPGDVRHGPMDGGPPPPANRITQELQRILNNLPATPGVGRWAGDGGGMPVPGPWQSGGRQSGWSGSHQPGGSPSSHPKRHDWMGPGRRLSMDGGYVDGGPRSERPGPMGGRGGQLSARHTGHDSRHQRTGLR